MTSNTLLQSTEIIYLSGISWQPIYILKERGIKVADLQGRSKKT